METVEVGGLRIAYERAGSGPPVVLVHGFVGDGHSTWGQQIEALSDEFTVVAWDAPGAGRSADPPAWFRIEHFADCFTAFVRALGFEAAHLVGLSFGGILVVSAAARESGVARSLALVGAYAGWRGSLGPDEATARLEKCLRLSEVTAEEFEQAMVPSMFSATAASPAVTEFVASVRRFRPPGFRVMSRASAEADLRAFLPEIRVPTLLVYGDHDARASLEVAEGLRSSIPASRLVILPGVGHVSPVEAPESVSRELRGFLRTVEHGQR